MPILRIDNLSLAFGHHQLLDQASFQLDRGERVCLVGRNGAGKSSLLKLLNQEMKPDDGIVWHQPGIRVACLRQDVPHLEQQTVFQVVAQGLGEVTQLLNEYHQLIAQVEPSDSEAWVKRLSHVQEQLDEHNAWQAQQCIDNTLSNLQLDPDVTVDTLSGGWRRRVFLAQALVSSPDILLLDEPTNHLDITAIQWLEKFLLTQQIGLLFITHDRAFLQRLATRIVDLDRGKLTSWPGDYPQYLARKAHLREVEADQNALFDKNLANEERWIREGIKARRTRNEGRVRRLEALRKQHMQRRDEAGQVKLNVVSARHSGNIVFDANNIGFAYDNNVVLKNFSTTIMRGDKVGLIGPNGVGKSTLLQILLGDIAAMSGEMRPGTRLDIAYFDQQHAVLDPEKTLIETVNDGNEFVTIDGAQRHVAGYLQDFLFESARLYSPVKSLSGGETNRLLLARLFAKPANVLVLDEPTNDLDIETLEMLEALLVDYQGTVLLVSHDREFLNNVVSSVLVFEGDGVVDEYVGGYDDYLRQQPSSKKTDSGASTSVVKKAKQKPDQLVVNADERKKPKLSYKAQRELEALPGLIEALEKEQNQLQQTMAASDFYQQDEVSIRQTTQLLSEVTQTLASKYICWEALEAAEKGE